MRARRNTVTTNEEFSPKVVYVNNRGDGIARRAAIGRAIARKKLFVLGEEGGREKEIEKDLEKANKEKEDNFTDELNGASSESTTSEIAGRSADDFLEGELDYLDGGDEVLMDEDWDDPQIRRDIGTDTQQTDGATQNTINQPGMGWATRRFALLDARSKGIAKEEVEEEEIVDKDLPEEDVVYVQLRRVNSEPFMNSWDYSVEQVYKTKDYSYTLTSYEHMVSASFGALPLYEIKQEQEAQQKKPQQNEEREEKKVGEGEGDQIVNLSGDDVPLVLLHLQARIAESEAGESKAAGTPTNPKKKKKDKKEVKEKRASSLKTKKKTSTLRSSPLEVPSEPGGGEGVVETALGEERKSPRRANSDNLKKKRKKKDKDSALSSLRSSTSPSSFKDTIEREERKKEREAEGEKKKGKKTGDKKSSKKPTVVPLFLSESNGALRNSASKDKISFSSRHPMGMSTPELPLPSRHHHRHGLTEVSGRMSLSPKSQEGGEGSQQSVLEGAAKKIATIEVEGIKRLHVSHSSLNTTGGLVFYPPTYFPPPLLLLFPFPFLFLSSFSFPLVIFLSQKM